MKYPQYTQCLLITTFELSRRILDSGPERRTHFLLKKKKGPTQIPEAGLLRLIHVALENELSAELHLSCRIVRTGDCPECGGAAQVAVGLAGNAVVEQVEGFGSEFESSSLAPHRELAKNRKVHIDES